MAPKRKRSGLQSPAPAPAPASLSELPRRSNRVGDRNSSAIDGVAPPGALGDPNRGRRRNRGKNAELGEDVEGVERAMRNLQDMELELQNALRRQRLAVESSDLSGEFDGDTPSRQTMPVQPPGSFNKSYVNEGDKELADSTEQAPLGGYEADIAEGDIAASKLAGDGVERGARRPPPVNSEALPLPWAGRLGYACLNTYLRASNPPVFSSRTCRMSSIIDHRHPLQHPDQPEHPVKNRPDKDKPADTDRGLKFVQDLGLANARDIVKMLRWNHKYGIRFMRLSSEMFPFASHQEHGYKLAPFASDTLAEAGRVAAELDHRVTTHPGQFTQLGSPRKEVISAAMRDLEYHNEMLSLLDLPEQMDRDAVMILHMGGTYGDKEGTLDRFRENYSRLSDGVKRRLVLENDDVAWSVHDLLPICEELNIPLVLDYHHHNIIFDAERVREGTLDIMQSYDRISKTWTRKGIRQKMHYSEQTAGAITPRERRKHSARVRTLPPCPRDMDLMIEAKDKEQAVFELMRTFRLPGWDLAKDVVPYERDDEPSKAVFRTKPSKRAKKNGARTDDGAAKREARDGEDDGLAVPERIVSDGDFGMGGPDNRVYWPEGMEEWLRPRKREVKKGKQTED